MNKPKSKADDLDVQSVSRSDGIARIPERTVAAFSLMAAFVTACVVGESLLLGEVIGTGHPQWTAYEIVRTALAAATSVLIVASIYSDGRAVRDDAPPLDAPLRPVMLGYALATVFVLLFLASPPLFSRFGLEDNGVEYASALLCLTGAALYLGAFRAAFGSARGTRHRRVALGLAPLCAVALFVLGMEEISWMQRIVGFETPEALGANLQGEANLHNFATNSLLSIYTLGGWAILILLPYIIAFGPRSRLLDLLHDFLPPPWMAALAAPIAGFNYNVWLFPPIQIMAFSSVLILAVFSRQAGRAGRQAAMRLYGAGAALVVVAQSVFLLGGDRFVRDWDVTEYQEFFIAFGLAALAGSVRQRVRLRSRQPQAARDVPR